MLSKLLNKWDPLSAVLLVSVLLRFWQLGYPDKLVFDEVHYVPSAKILVGVAPHPGLAQWKNYPMIVKSPDINFSHPPLGKMIIGTGIRIFGDTPFGWRFFSAVFGVLSVWVMFYIGLKLFKDQTLATLGAFLLSFDYLHILQSRMAMLDIFLLFFGMLAMLAMLYLVDEPKSKTWLFVAALAIALDTSTKYVAALAGVAALAVFFVMSTDSRKEKLKTISKVAGLSIGIYFLWAIYYYHYGYNFIEFFRYHWAVAVETLGPLAHHSYGSSPYEWLFNSKTLLYFVDRNGDYAALIYALGNPVIWVGFLLSSYVIFANYWSKKQKIDLALTLWFLISYVPLIFILWRRQGFIYHMMPIVPVMCLAVTRVLDLLTTKYRQIIRVFVIAVIAATVLGYPILIGSRIPVAVYDVIER